MLKFKRDNKLEQILSFCGSIQILVIELLAVGRLEQNDA